MPNWCHNTLTVKGEANELARFVEAARPQEAVIHAEWKAWTPRNNEKKPPFKKHFAEVLEAQPLSFASLVPEPSPEELRKLEQYKPCTMCGAYGTLPESQAQASDRGARWFDWMDPVERPNRTCNVCGGSKEERVGSEGWYTWRVANWGCKWDASFGEPFLALGADDADVDETVAALGGTITPTVAIYKFDTPWAPPVPFVEAAGDLFPTLIFELRFGEPGEGYAGEVIFADGGMDETELAIEDVLAPEEMWF